MKRVYTIMRSFSVALVLLAISCETEQLTYKGSDFVRFTEATLTKKESDIKPVKIEINTTKAPDADLSLAYSISGTAREGVDYTITSERGKVVIKKGEYFGYITVQLINNANNILRSQDIIFTLQTSNNSAVEVGQGVSAIGKSFTLTIQDDCILSGSYSGTRSAFAVPVQGITISSNDCETYTLSNWNINLFSPPYDYSLTFTDNGDNTLTIPEQDEMKGNGVIDPVTKVITMNLIFIGLNSDGSDATTTITLTPDK